MSVPDLPPDEVSALARLRRADASWPKTRWFLLLISLLLLGVSVYGRYRQGEALLELANARPGSVSPVMFAVVAQNASLFKVTTLLSVAMLVFSIVSWRGLPSRSFSFAYSLTVSPSDSSLSANTSYLDSSRK